MRRREFLGLAGGAFLVAGRGLSVAQETSNEQRFRNISRLIEAKMAEHLIPGVAFGLVKNGDTHLAGFGLTNIDNPQPVTPDTVFPIASISKTVVATALMRLVDEGRIDVEAPVQTYLPDFELGDAAAARELRVWHLLTHTPGFEGQLGTDVRGEVTLKTFTEGLRDLPQLAPPGAVWSYNNAGFGVAGRVLEVVTGASINEALSSLVFEPIGLPHAFTRTGTAMTYRFATGHRDSGASGETVVIRPFRLPANVSAGGAAMSLRSLIRYARFHLGEVETHLLSRESRELMRTPRVQKNSTSDEMGLGWHSRRLGSVLTAAHGGTLGGHCLHVQLVPERQLAFTLLTNHNSGWRLIQDVERAILDRYEGLALAPGQPTGGNRGGNEDMTRHAAPLQSQPDPEPYVGDYQRPPNGTAEVRAVGGRLVVRGGGAGDRDVPLVFWGPDLTYAEPDGDARYPYRGMPIEFIRNPAGNVGWIRINGRIAVKG